MKINHINMLHFSHMQNLKENKTEKNSTKQNNLFKKNNINISFKSQSAQIKAAKELIAKLVKENITYDVLQHPKGITVAEFKNIITLHKTTTFLANNKKKVIVYKPDGKWPHAGYIYEKDKLTKITQYSIEGQKKYTETLSKIGRREKLTIYDKNGLFPRKQIEYHLDGSTPKREILFHEGTKQHKSIQIFSKDGKIKALQTFDKKGTLTNETVYDKNGQAIKNNN